MRKEFDKSGRSDEFKIERLVATKSCSGFNCPVTERTTGRIAAYMSLIKNRKTVSMRKDLYK